MPRNFKETMLFTGLMCGLMVLGVSVYNLALSGHFSLSHLLLGFFPGFCVALVVDLLIAGRIAKPLAFKSLRCLKSGKVWDARKELICKVFLISFFMVLVMVTLMSVYGIILSQMSFTPVVYARTWGLNFIMAFPLNLLVVGPLSRFILTQVQTIKVV